MRANLKSRSIPGLLAASILFLASGSAFAQQFIGIDYGPFHLPGQAPHTPITDSQYLSDLGILAAKFTHIKTYGDDADSRLDQVVPLAASHFPKLKIYQGVFENSEFNSAADTTYLDTAISLANTYPQTVAAVVVGNECLDTDSNSKPITVAQLIADLKYVRSRLKNKGAVQVTSALGYQAAVSYGVQIKPHVDNMMINIYPFFGKVPIGGAITNLLGAYAIFKDRFNGKQVIIGETGWPSAGATNGSSVPNLANEAAFTKAVFANKNKLGSTFAFSAFDEQWLIVQNSWGPHWGLWNANSTPKFAFP